MSEAYLPFTAEHLVIITSDDEIEAPQWRKYLITNWDKLTRKNAKLLILAGIHGGEEGEIGPSDDGLLKDNIKQIKLLKRKFENEMKENNIDIMLEDVGKHLNPSQLDEDKLIQVIKTYNPTLLIHAFCWTSISRLNDIFRSQGIYTILIMQENHAKITEGKYVVLDPDQRQIVETVVMDNPSSVFLWGSSGTGKTLLITQVLNIKASHYRRLGKKVNIIITSQLDDDGKSLLMKDLRLKYLPNLEGDDEVRFIGFHQLCQELKFETDRLHQQLTINYLIHSLALLHEDSHTILLVDEIMSSSEGAKADWSQLITDRPNIDVILALNPQGIGGDVNFQVIPPPTSKKVLAKQLLMKHRNCFEISLLMEWLKHLIHLKDGKLQSPSILDPSRDKELNSDNLPEGRTSVWLQKAEVISDVEILERIKSNHVRMSETVTVLFHGEDGPNDVTKEWCDRNSWSYLDNHQMAGCEDQCVVLMDCPVLLENISRARNGLVIVTTRG